jgi:hypothetical protein
MLRPLFIHCLALPLPLRGVTDELHWNAVVAASTAAVCQLKQAPCPADLTIIHQPGEFAHKKAEIRTAGLDQLFLISAGHMPISCPITVAF